MPRSALCMLTLALDLSLFSPRNVLTESARIARGKITDLAKLSADNHDAAIFPGGFGAAKNLYVLELWGLFFTCNAAGGGDGWPREPLQGPRAQRLRSCSVTGALVAWGLGGV